MGGGGTEQTVQTSAPSNPAVDATTTKLMNNLQGQVDRGSAVYGQTLNPGAGATTQQGWQAMLSGANNPVYSQGISSATSDMADIAAGRRFGTNDPGYQTLRRGLIDDVTANTNAAFNASGRYGGASNVQDLSEGLTNGLAGLDYQNFQNDQQRQMGAIQALPQLYAAGLAPAGIISGVGQEQDANALALRQGEADLFDRQNNAGWNTLGRASSILAGTAGASGTTQTTTSPTAPWWQQALGAGAMGAGIYGSIFK